MRSDKVQEPKTMSILVDICYYQDALQEQRIAKISTGVYVLVHEDATLSV